MGNRFNSYNDEIKAYLIKQYDLYQQKKLTYNEEVQFFQDMLDSGLIFNMDDNLKLHTRILLDKGFITSSKKEGSSSSFIGGLTKVFSLSPFKSVSISKDKLAVLSNDSSS